MAYSAFYAFSGLIRFGRTQRRPNSKQTSLYKPSSSSADISHGRQVSRQYRVAGKFWDVGTTNFESKAPEGPKIWVLPTVPLHLRTPYSEGVPHKLVPYLYFLHSGAPASVGYGLYENKVVH